MMVVLVPASDAEPSLQPATMSELARLGVTSVAVLRDARTVGLVVEGWAFRSEPIGGSGGRRRRRSDLGRADAAPGPALGSAFLAARDLSKA
jgi:hypothetical protein